MDKIINSLDIAKKNIAKIGENRAFTIRGTKGASFILQVVNSASQFYNFSTKVFDLAASHTPENIFKGTLSSNSLSGRIQFPVVSATATYNIVVIADPSTDTILNSKAGAINTSITQVLDTTISFQLLTDSANYATLPSALNVVASPSNPTQIVNFAQSFANIANDAKGFGLKISRQPTSEDLVFRNTHATVGTSSGIGNLELDSVEDLTIGTHVISGTGLSGTPYIKAIDKNTKIISLSTAQSFGNDVTLTFEARGVKTIGLAIGVVVNDLMSSFGVSISPDGYVEKNVVATGATEATDSSQVTIALNGTYGIAGGDTVTYTGDGVDNNGDNAVTSVTAGASAGSIVVEKAQHLVAGTVLKFVGSYSALDFKSGFTIEKFGPTNRVINILLDNFITPGEAA